MKAASALALVLILAATPNAAAGDEPATTADLSATYRFRTNAVSDQQVDFRGDRSRQSRFEEHRLRLRGKIAPTTHLSILGEVDLFSGMVSGDRANPLLSTEEMERTRFPGRSRMEPRQLHADLLLPFGFLQVGQVAAHWGLGMVANDGEPGRNDFGDEYFGNLYDQVLFATKPFLPGGGRLKNLVTALVLGSVYRDPLADRIRGDEENPLDWDLQSGDRAWQIALAAFNDEEGRKVGVQSVLRRQRFESGRDLKALLADAFVDIHLPERGAYLPYIRAEVAGSTGTSTEFANVNALSGADVLQGGGVIRLGARQPVSDVSAELGYASGDRNPFDDKVTSFVFHPDFNVGLILFDEVLNHFTAATASTLGDPALVGQAPGGIHLFATDGGVSNAWYAQVKGKRRIWGSESDEPRTRRADFILAGLYALSDQPLLDPASMTLSDSGGSPTNFLGAATSSRDLGFEMDAGVRARFPFSNFTPECGIEAGYFLPGHAFTTLSGTRLANAYKVRILISLAF